MIDLITIYSKLVLLLDYVGLSTHISYNKIYTIHM